MDQYIGEMDCRYKSDSIMMRLLRSAMDKAHEKVQYSQEGPIECLHERSKFYELAIIQIEGSLDLIQEETDERISETSREKMLSDLMELHDLLQGRLDEMKVSIVEKDKELMERLETEFKLRQALELKERELVSLRANLERERTKSEEIQDFLVANHANGDELAKEGEGNFCDLKNSVDQQVLNIKQRLEDESYSPLDEERYMGPEINPLGDSLRPEQNIVIKQMSSDIDILKGTLELAFGRMRIAEVRPLEKQWRGAVEKEIISILLKGFMSDLERKFEEECIKRETGVHTAMTNERWSELIKLRSELEGLTCQNEVQGKSIERSQDNSTASSSMRRTTSEPLPDVDHMEELAKDDATEDRSHYVAKMIKNHESIIRRQCEELHRRKKEVLRHKGESYGKREKDPDGLERRIQDVIARLDDVIKWKDKLGADHGVCDQASSREKNIAKERQRICCNLGFQDEVQKLRQGIEDLKLETKALEETYLVLFRGLVKDFYLELDDYDVESLIRENISIQYLRELVNGWSLNLEHKCMKIQVRQEVYCIVCRETVKDFCRFASGEHQDYRDEGYEKDSTSSNRFLHYLENSLRVDVHEVFLCEMVKEWNEKTGRHARSVESTASFELSQHQEVAGGETIESLLKEDVYMVFFREMVRAWYAEKRAYDIENVIGQDIYQFIIAETIKDVRLHPCKTESLSEKCLPEELPSGNLLDKSSKCNGDENFIQKLDSLLKSFEVEKDLMLEATFDIKEHSPQDGHVILKSEESDETDMIKSLRTEDERTFSSVSNKLEKALLQLGSSRELLKELTCSTGAPINLLENAENNVNSGLQAIHEKDQSSLEPKDTQLVQSSLFDSGFSLLIKFQKSLSDFEHMVEETLAEKCLRLEQVQHQLDPLVQLTVSMRKRKLLYKKAFLRRCHNLQLAETEVDLLGDQVDGLVSLLEKIYLILNQYSPVLSRYFKVLDILELIKKELLVHHTSDLYK